MRTPWLVALFFLLAALGPARSPAVGPEGSLDARGWELVSPTQKSGGQVGTPQDPGAGSFQASASGETLSYGSGASFGGGAGAPPVSQYVATRGADDWLTENISPPLLSGTYAGGAYQLFSADLSRALLSNGWRCRSGGIDCAAENAPLAGNALPGYRALYLRQAGGYSSLLTVSNSPQLSVGPEDFRLSLAGATPDLGQVVISTCAALTVDATEVSAGSDCDSAAPNLYRWSEGTLSAINFLPAQAETAPGAVLAAPAGAISSNGSRVYWTLGGALYLREGAVTKLVAPAAAFQVATADGSIAYYLAGGHLYRYDAVAASSEDLTPSGGVLGVLGASASGSSVYYLTGAGLFLRQGATTTFVAAGADPVNYPPATGSAQVSADGSRLAFVSSASLTGFPNAGKAEVFLYEAAAPRLVCVSCNQFNAAPLGSASLPGARAAAEGPAAYKPRALSADGRRLFFDSVDRLVPQDTDGLADAYEWEAGGSGSCTVVAGCLGLISYGRAGADSFLDAGADGRDAFFLTSASLLPRDIAGLDVYDARAGGGFPEPSTGVVCEGDTCQGIVPPPNDPAPGSATVQGPPNPAPHVVEPPKKKRKHHKQKRDKGKHGRHRGAVIGGHR